MSESEAAAVVLPMESAKRSGLAKARLAFRAAVTNPPRTSKAAYGEYCPMDVMERHCFPLMGEHGLDFSSREDVQGNTQVLISTLTHTPTGEFERAISVIGQPPSQPQKQAADVTYIRRRHFQELLCLTADTDQDGNHPPAPVQERKEPVVVRPAESVADKARGAIAKAGSPERLQEITGRMSDAVEDGRLAEADYHKLIKAAAAREAELMGCVDAR